MHALRGSPTLISRSIRGEVTRTGCSCRERRHMMGIIAYFNERVKRLSIFDIKLVQLAAMFVVLIIVKLIPRIMNVSIWWFAALAVLSAIRPVRVLFFSK